MLKISSWNVNSLNVRLPQLLSWLPQAQPDIVGLQETKLTDDKFPQREIEEAGYQVAFAGQKTYNGVALLSKQPIDDVAMALPGLDDPQRRVLAATINGIRVINVYIPNGQAVGSDKYAYKLGWLNALHQFIEQQLSLFPKLVLMGDFNIAPEDADVHDPISWAGQILCSEPERAAFQGLVKLGMRDTFRQFAQAPETFSWWDYRAAGFRRNLGLRIDIILASAVLANCCRSSVVDIEPRRGERPSDHAPVIAEFEV